MKNKEESILVEEKLKNAVSLYSTSRLEVVNCIGLAKKNLKAKEYRELVKLSGLSKDQVSMSLKRYQMVIEGFNKTDIMDYSDGAVKIITNKRVENNGELLRARKQLATHDINFDEFKELYNSFRPIKTDDEKAVKGAESLVKLVINSPTIKPETIIEVAEICKPLNAYLEE